MARSSPGSSPATRSRRSGQNVSQGPYRTDGRLIWRGQPISHVRHRSRTRHAAPTGASAVPHGMPSTRVPVPVARLAARRRIQRRRQPLADCMAFLSTGHWKAPDSAQLVDHNLQGVRIGHRLQEPVWTSVRGAGVKAVSPAKRGGSERSALTPVSTRARCLSDDVPSTPTSCGGHESRIDHFPEVANMPVVAGGFSLSTVTSGG